MKKVFFMASALVMTTAVAQQKKDSTRVIDEVLINAIRAKETLPVTFSNLSKNEIKKKNFGQQMPMLLTSLPNVVSYSEDGTGFGATALFIRGNDLQRTNVTINGIPYNDSESLGVYWYNLSDFAGSAESIQVQRGVGTSTNGAGAFGASLNVLTDAVSEKPYGEIANFYGSYNAHKHSLKFSTGKINDRFEISGRLSKINSNGYIDRASANLKSYFFQGAYSHKNTLIKALVFGGTEKTYLTYKGIDARQLETNRRYNPAGAYYDAQGNVHFYDNETDNYQQDHAQLHWAQRWSPYWTTNIAFHYTKGRGYWEQMDNWGDKNGNFVIQYLMDNDFYGTTFSSNYKKDKIDFVFGGSANSYEGRHFDEYVWTEKGTKAHRERLGDMNYGKKNEASAFAKLSYQLDEKWDLFGDIQYRYVGFKSKFSNVQIDEGLHLFNPKFGVTYKIDEGNNLYLSYARATKEANRSDYKNYAENINNGSVLPKAESVNDFELGWRLVSHTLKLNANIYYMDYKDQLVLTGDISKTGYSLRKNSGNSYRLGLEVDALLKISDKLIWQPNFSLSRNRNINYHSLQNKVAVNMGDTNTSFSPSVVASSGLTFIPINDFQVSWVSKYVGARYLTNENEANAKLDAFWVNNLNLSYELRPANFCKSITFALDVNNFLNNKYYSHGRYKKGKAYYFPQATANVMAGVTFHF